MDHQGLSEILDDLITDVPFSSKRDELSSIILMKEICEIEDFREELDILKKILLRQIQEGLSIQNIKLLIIREIRKITNSLIIKKEECTEKLEKIDPGSDESD